MKKTLLLLTILLGTYFHIYAQEQSTMNSGVGMGFHLVQNQQDFGLGLNITSPYFANNKIAVRARGNLMWHQHLDIDETTWSPYTNISLGIIGVGGEIGDFARLYGEGGIIALFPSDDFSSESSEMGGYGIFGFEFYMSSASNYFIEIGGTGIGSNADKIPGSPIYSNGMSISVGYRHTFR